MVDAALNGLVLANALQVLFFEETTKDESDIAAPQANPHLQSLESTFQGILDENSPTSLESSLL